MDAKIIEEIKPFLRHLPMSAHIYLIETFLGLSDEGECIRVVITKGGYKAAIPIDDINSGFLITNRGLKIKCNEIDDLYILTPDKLLNRLWKIFADIYTQ